VRRKWQFVFNRRYSNTNILIVNVKTSLFSMVEERAVELQFSLRL
jgi:hypothetical protein